jgi:hypothetical protein
MDKEKKKKPYEPPLIYEMEVDLTQAMGQTQCGRGTNASGACNPGRNPAGVNCSAGPGAAVQCTNGNRPGANCSSGNHPAM